MERDTIALTVEHDRAKAMRANLMNSLQNLTAVGRDCPDSLREAPLGVEINERAFLGRRVVLARRI